MAMFWGSANYGTGMNLYKLCFVGINTMKTEIEASHHSTLHMTMQVHCASNHFKSCVSNICFDL